MTARDALAAAPPERRAAVHKELWSHFREAADQVVKGELDKFVFDHMYTVQDVAMYSVDGTRGVQLLLDVVCRGVLCEPNCFGVSCGNKCSAVRIPAFGADSVVQEETKRGEKASPKELPDNTLLRQREWVQHLDTPVLISGWLDASTALCFYSMRQLLRRLGCPNLVSSVMVPPPLPQDCVGVPRLLPLS